MKRLQRADQRLGALACALLQPLRWFRREAPLERPARRVLSIKFWGIGSLQLLTPAVSSLRRRHPEAELVFLTLAQNGECAAALGVFDRVLTLDVAAAGWPAIFARILRLSARLRGERFDEVYDFEFFTRFSAVVSLLTGARRTHGFASNRTWRGGFHTDVAQFNRYWHVARNFRVLAGGEDGRNVTASDLDPCRFSEADLARVAELLAARELDPGTPFAVLNPNAGSLSLERRWPAPRFAELARRLAREDRLAVVLVGSASEREHTRGVRTLAGREVIDLAGELSTAELAALLSRASVVVSNDSGPMHLAAALGAPTVGLFGPETPLMYAPLGLRTRALYRPPPCSPCINVHDNKLASCVFGEPQCLMAISVEEVLGVARALVRGEEFEIEPSAPAELGRIASAYGARHLPGRGRPSRSQAPRA